MWGQKGAVLRCRRAAVCGKQARGRLLLQPCTPAGPALQAFTSVQLYIDSLLSYGALGQGRKLFEHRGQGGWAGGWRAGGRAPFVTLCLIASESSAPLAQAVTPAGNRCSMQRSRCRNVAYKAVWHRGVAQPPTSSAKPSCAQPGRGAKVL